MQQTSYEYPLEILLVEDNLGDVRLILEILKESLWETRIHVAKDGAEALAFLQRKAPYQEAKRPDIILLDLNLPGMDGRELLTIIKHDKLLKRLPVVVLTSSDAEQDIASAYDLHANCFITKPVDLEQFSHVVRAINDFWMTIAQIPSI
ncbi:MAG: response regulator [Caldilineaceae bacterium]